MNFRLLKIEEHKRNAVYYAICTILLAGLVISAGWAATHPVYPHYNFPATEKVAIQKDVSVGSDRLTVTLIAQSTGGEPVALQYAVIKNLNGSVYATSTSSGFLAGEVVPSTATSVKFTSSLALVSGDTYIVVLVSKAGGSFVSPSFTVP